MAQIIIPGKWMQQPRSLATDIHNTFTEGLVGVLTPFGEHLTKSPPIYSGTKNYANVSQGLGINSPIRTSGLPLTFSNKATIMVVANKPLSSSALSVYGVRITDGYRGDLFHLAQGGWEPSLSVLGWFNNSTHSSVGTTPGLGPLTDGTHTYLVTRDSSNINFHKADSNNIDTQDTNFATTIWTPSSNIQLFMNQHWSEGAWVPAASNSFGLLLAVWNRVIDAETLSNLAQNPWQIFKPIKRQFWVGPAANIFTRYARPLLDISNSGWSASSGSDLYAMIDEETPSDTDYIFATTSGATYEGKLQPVEDPATSTNQVIKYRTRSIYGNTLIAKLKQGSTVIATRTHESVPSEWTTYSMILSESEANAITDYTDLRIVTEIA